MTLQGALPSVAPLLRFSVDSTGTFAGRSPSLGPLHDLVEPEPDKAVLATSEEVAKWRAELMRDPSMAMLTAELPASVSPGRTGTAETFGEEMKSGAGTAIGGVGTARLDPMSVSTKGFVLDPQLERLEKMLSEGYTNGLQASSAGSDVADVVGTCSEQAHGSGQNGDRGRGVPRSVAVHVPGNVGGGFCMDGGETGSGGQGESSAPTDRDLAWLEGALAGVTPDPAVGSQHSRGGSTSHNLYSVLGVEEGSGMGKLDEEDLLGRDADCSKGSSSSSSD